MMNGFGRGSGYGYGDMMGGGWFGSLLVLFFGAVLIAGIVLLVIWATKRSSGNGTAGSSAQSHGAVGHDEAVSVAKRRLANGEINTEQYNEIMRSLGT